MTDPRIAEAVELFEEVLVYGTERLLRTVDNPIWDEYSREQIQVLKLIAKEGSLTSRRLASLQAVHKSAVSIRIKKLLSNELIRIVESKDKREKLLELTSAGHEIVRQSNHVLSEYLQHLMTDRIDDVEFEQFLLLFRKLRTIMKMEEV